MGDGSGNTTEMVIDLHTIELTTGKLDSMLFEIPPDYTETKNMVELQDKFDPTAMMKQYTDKDKDNTDDNPVNIDVKKPGVTLIGILEPKGEGQFQPSVLQQHLVSVFNSGNYESVAVTSEEDARAKNCDLLLNTEFVRVKQVNKVGGLLKAIKNTDPNAASSFNIEANMVLTKIADGTTRAEQSVNGKYEGKPDDAAMKALDEGSRAMMKILK